MRRAERARKLGIEGLEFIPEYDRAYPRTWMASQLLGNVGADGGGLSGLEYGLDGDLRGHDGERRLVKDALGDTLELDEVKRAEDGANVRLTLDAAIQDQTEEVLAEVGETWRPKGATALVMDPDTGAILALANWPRVNANKLYEAPDYAMMNRAVGHTYEPGSTFKAFTVASALEDGEVTPDTMFDLPPVLQVADREITDSHARGWETRSTAGIIAESSNVGAALIERRMGARRFDQWVRRFGFGKPTGVDLPGEESGILLTYDEYSGSTAANMAMGQGLAVTPMQMGAAYAAIANGGILRPPHIVEAVDGKERARPARAPRDLRGHRVGGAQHARGRARAGRHRHRRGDRRLRAGRQDRHRGEARRERRLLQDEVRRVVRRLRARQGPEAARRRHGRRAAGRHLRRHGRRPGLQEDHGVRADELADRALIARQSHRISRIPTSEQGRRDGQRDPRDG